MVLNIRFIDMYVIKTMCTSLKHYSLNFLHTNLFTYRVPYKELLKGERD